MEMDKKIAVLIPCYNEEMTIGKVIDDFHRVCPDADVYVYNNNSTDATAAIAAAKGAIVREEYRQGKGNVIRSMFRDIDADCYIMVDGDDTYPAEDAWQWQLNQSQTRLLWHYFAGALFIVYVLLRIAFTIAYRIYFHYQYTHMNFL